MVVVLVEADAFFQVVDTLPNGGAVFYNFGQNQSRSRSEARTGQGSARHAKYFAQGKTRQANSTLRHSIVRASEQRINSDTINNIPRDMKSTRAEEHAITWE